MLSVNVQLFCCYAGSGFGPTTHQSCYNFLRPSFTLTDDHISKFALFHINFWLSYFSSLMRAGLDVPHLADALRPSHTGVKCHLPISVSIFQQEERIQTSVVTSLLCVVCEKEKMQNAFSHQFGPLFSVLGSKLPTRFCPPPSKKKKKKKAFELTH